MEIKGILFDKDGTILKFQDLWLDAAKHVIREFILINHIPQSEEMQSFLLKAMGVENDIINPDGALAYMTYEQIGAIVAAAMWEKNPEWGISDELAGRQMSVLFETVLTKEQLACTPTCDLKKLFQELKKRGIYIGLATADNLPVTKQCLKQLDVEDVFDFIGCDDGIMHHKPHSDMFNAFCEKYHLKPQEVAVVGDTANDMYFARNGGGIAVGTLSGLGKKETFKGLADYIIYTPENLPSLLDKLCARKIKVY